MFLRYLNFLSWLFGHFCHFDHFDVARHLLPNISRSKGNQGKKSGQLIEYNVRNSFLHNYAENELGRLVPDSFWFLKKFYGHVFLEWAKKELKKEEGNYKIWNIFLKDCRKREKNSKKLILFMIEIGP